MVWSLYNQLIWIVGFEFKKIANFNIYFLGIKILNFWFHFFLIFKIIRKLQIFNFSLSFSSDPLFLEWNTRFTAIPFKVLCDQVWITLCPAMFIILNNFRCGLLANKNDFHISTIQTIEKLSEFIIFQARKTMLSFTLFISLRFHAP